MAKKQNEALFTNELLLEQQKKNKKPFYKNWKTYAISLGIIVIGAGTGLGIYYGVSTKQGTTPPTPGLTDQDIIAEINEASYELSAFTGDDVSTINSQITPEFIQEKLSDKIKEAFKLESFHFNKITVNGEELNNNHLAEAKTIIAQISYNYGLTDEVINGETSLTINVTEAPITDQQIIAAINSASYEKEVKVNSKASAIEINTDFIKNKLSDKIKTVFNNIAFQFEKITINDQDLDDIHLTKSELINTKILYHYGLANEVISGETSLTINITGIDNYQIVDAINSVKTYQISTITGSDINPINKQINGGFIKDELSKEIQVAFNDNSFYFNKITFNGEDLSNEHLKKETTLNAKINYNYGVVKEIETDLTIKVQAAPITDQDISNAINNASYELTADTSNGVSTINNKITPEFIKAKLTGKIKETFKLESFHFNQITIDGKPLVNSDLTKAKTLNAKIVYTYGTIQNAETKLTIELSDDRTLVNAINSMSETNAWAKLNESSSQFCKNVFQPQYIRSQMSKQEVPENISKTFQDNKFTFNKIVMIESDGSEHDLTDQDLETVGFFNAKLIYNYGNFKNQEIQLELEVRQTSTFF